MRISFFLLLSAFSLLISLQSKSQAQAVCGFDAIFQKELQKDIQFKKLVEKTDAEWARHAIMLQQSRRLPITENQDTIFEIPVVIHVFHTGGAPGTKYNPTDAALEEWIDYLNDVFAADYPGYPDSTNGGTPLPVRFALAKRDPQCAPTNGIERIDMSGNTKYVNYGLNSSGSTGLDDNELTSISQWPIDTYYNIYVVNKIDGEDGFCSACTFTAGYAYLGMSNPAPQDGAYMLARIAEKGQTTLPHEIGHALGLYHVFNKGSQTVCPPNTGNCYEDNDKVCDTDPSRMLLGTCPSAASINPCTGAPYGANGVQHNIMNYSQCPNHFTPGQAERMMFMLKTYRPNLINSWGALPPDSRENAPLAADCIPTVQTTPTNANMGPCNVLLDSIQYYSLGFIQSAGYPNNQFYVDHTNDCSLPVYTTLTIGDTYTLTVTTQTNRQLVKAYIDYNNDGVFDEATETIMDKVANKATDTLSISFSPPEWAVMDVPLRMRVVSDYFNVTISPCGPLQYGQAEDFKVFVRAEGALPVLLRNFEGRVVSQNQARFTWNLDPGDNETSSFELERSNNGKDFERVSSVKRLKGQLSYFDSDLASHAGNFFYRLALISPNNQKTYSKIIKLKFVQNENLQIRIFPNPVSNQLTIKSKSSIHHIEIMDQSGRIISTITNLNPGIFEKQINFNNFSSGLYIIRVTDSNGSSAIEKIIKK